MGKIVQQMNKFNNKGAYYPVKMRMNNRASCDVFVPREKKLFKSNPNAQEDNRVSPALQVQLNNYS